MPGKKGRGGANPGRGILTVEWVRSGKPSGVQAIWMEISRSLDYSPELARVVSIPNCRILEASTKRGTIVTRWSPLPPNFERTGQSSGESGARHRGPIGDPLNDEQRSDHLFNPSSHQTAGSEMVIVRRHEPESLQGLGRRYPQ